MSDQNRGAYTPHNEPPLAFDARQPIRGGGGPAPLTLIVSALVLVGLVVAVVMFYRQGPREPGQAPQAVGAPVETMKVPAAQPAAPTEGSEGLQITSEDPQAVDAAPVLAPPPEQPQPLPAPRPVPPPAPVAATPPPVKAATPPPPVKAPTAAVIPPASPAKTPPAAAATTPAPKPPAFKPAIPPAPAPAPAATGTAARVQIGAFSSQALAEKGWNDVAGQAPAAMAGKGKRVEPVEVNGKTLYRTFITGFDSRADAQAFCASIGRNAGNCLVR